MWNMVNSAEQVQIPTYRTYAYKSLYTAHVSIQPCSNIRLSGEEGERGGGGGEFIY